MKMNITYKSLCKVAKAVHRCFILHTKKRKILNHLTFCLRELKNEKIKLNVSKINKIISVRTDIK